LLLACGLAFQPSPPAGGSLWVFRTQFSVYAKLVPRVSYYWGRLWFRSCCPCQVPYQFFRWLPQGTSGFFCPGDLRAAAVPCHPILSSQGTPERVSASVYEPVQKP